VFSTVGGKNLWLIENTINFPDNSPFEAGVFTFPLLQDQQAQFEVKQ